jgi:anti-sigma factor RsiW
MGHTESDRHLTDPELFALAAPASGEPEALPRHLSACQACSRALQEWKAAVRALAEEEVDEIEKRTPQEWRAAEDATMAAIRRSAPRRTRRSWRWGVGIAASLVILALAMPWPGKTDRPSAESSVGSAADDPSSLSAADRDDDALLREAAYLARGGDDSSDLAMEGSL